MVTWGVCIKRGSKPLFSPVAGSGFKLKGIYIRHQFFTMRVVGTRMVCAEKLWGK